MINEELISAYLDGELTAQEQAQVEQALASDARLRQMHDDLRMLRTSLQALPQQKLDANFAERVLQAAKKAQHDNAATAPVVTPSAAAAPREPEVIVTSHHGATVELAQHEPFAWRVVVWSVAGLAAVLMVMLFLPRTTEIAELPESKTKVALQPAEKPAEREELQNNAPPSPEGGIASRSLTEPMAESASDSKQMQSQATAANALRETDQSIDKPKSAAVPGAQRSMERRDMAAKKFDTTDSPRFGGLMRGAAPPPAAQPSDGIEAAKSVERKQAAAFRQDNDGEQQELVEAARNDQVVVVRLQTSRKLAKQRSIDDVLSRNAIALRDADTRDNRSKAEAFAADERALQGRDKAQREALGGAKRQMLDQLAKATNEADVVYVEASLAQVQAAIAELRAQPDTTLAFTSLEKALPNKDAVTAGVGGGGLPGIANGELRNLDAAGTSRSVAPPPPPAPVLADTAPPAPAGAKEKSSKETQETELMRRRGNFGFAERLSTWTKTERLKEAEEQDASGKSSNAPAELATQSPPRTFNGAAGDEDRVDGQAMQQRVRVVFVIEASDE